ncbi:MAG TPA: signal peptidase I [Niabella sp.]|nr:signal peptidase I [Niabella sp.]
MSNKVIVPVKYFIYFSLGATLLWLLFFDVYKVETGSMIPSIRPIGYIFILKYSFLSPEIDKNSIYVFEKSEKKKTFNNNKIYVKRCIAVAGDTLVIKKEGLDQKYPSKIKDSSLSLCFPHNKLFNWKPNEFGPIWLPRKGDTISLNEKNFILYEGIIKDEGNNLVKVSDKVFTVNGIQKKYYIFKENYYFMLGDNFYESEDSREFGPISRKNIRGKVFYIMGPF